MRTFQYPWGEGNSIPQVSIVCGSDRYYHGIHGFQNNHSQIINNKTASM